MPPTGLFPRGGPRPTSSRGEQDLYQALAEHLPPTWTAWHSLRLRAQNTWEGEGDFVLAIPERGVLILEVKGGAIEQRDGQWFQNGRRMDQAPRDQAHRFRRLLQAKLEEKHAGFKPWVAIATAFPQTPFSRPPTQGDLSNAVIGQQDLVDLGAALQRVADEVFQRPSDAGGPKPTPPPRDLAWIDVLHALWGETWTPRLALGNRARMRERELVVLDREQHAVLDQLGGNRRLIVTGGPGTGKTLLAREALRRLDVDSQNHCPPRWWVSQNHDPHR